MREIRVKRLSVEEAFVWAQRFAAREWRLLLPVAFFFFALPPLARDMLVPATVWSNLARATPADVTPMLAMLGWLLPVALVMLAIAATGGLAVTALALVPAISVREAILLALRRLPVLIGAMAILFVGLLAAAVVVAIVVDLAKLDPVTTQALMLGVILGLGLFASARLSLIPPLLIERGGTPPNLLRQAWALTHGVFWRVLGALAAYLVGVMVLLLALGTAVGAVLAILAKVTGVAELNTVLTGVVMYGLGALASTGMHLLVVGLYRQLAGSMRGI